MSNSPIPFPGGNNVPLVGQICTFIDVQPDVLICCTCDGPFIDRLIRFKAWGAVGRCRGCGRHMTIKVMAFNMASQQVQIEIMPVIPRDLGESQMVGGPPDGAKPS